MSLKVVELNYVKEKIDYNGDIEDLNHVNIITNANITGDIGYFGYKEIDNEYKVYIAFDDSNIKKSTFDNVYCTTELGKNGYVLCIIFRKDIEIDNIIYEIEDIEDVILKDKLDVVIEDINKGLNRRY